MNVQTLERGVVRTPTMERGGEHCVGNGRDRGRVDIVVDDVDKNVHP